jgi:autotransporter-associated beta strand protein
MKLIGKKDAAPASRDARGPVGITNRRSGRNQEIAAIRRRRLRFAACASVAIPAASMLLRAHTAKAATQYWDVNGNGTWDTASLDWSGNSTGTGGTGDVAFGNGSDAVFSTSAVTAGDIAITTTNVSAHSITFNGTNPTNFTFTSDGLLTLGASGTSSTIITLSSGAGAVTFQGGVAFQQNATATLVNNSSSLLTFAGAIGSSAPTGNNNILSITGNGSGGFTFSGGIVNNYGSPNAGNNTSVIVNTANSTVTTLSGANTYTGNTTVSAGTIDITGTLGNTAIVVKGGTFSLQNASAVSQNTITVVGGALTETVVNALSGNAALTVSSGTATLSSANNFTGPTSVTGTLQLKDSNAIASSALTLNSGATLQLRSDGNTTFAPATITSAVSGAAMTIDVNNANPAGGDTVSGNTLTLGNITFNQNNVTKQINVTGGNGYALSLGAITDAFGTSGGPYNFTINATTAPVTIASFAASAWSNNLILEGGNNITFTGNLTEQSAGDLEVTIQGSGTVVTLDGTTVGSTGTHGTIFNLASGATLNVNNSGALITTSHNGNFAAGKQGFFIAGGTLDNTSGGNITETNNPLLYLNGDFSFGGTGNLSLGTGAVSLGTTSGATRTITTNSANAGTALTIGGIISNGNGTPTPAINLAKAGPGTLILTGVEAYTGTTAVNAGTLQLKTGSLLTSSGVSIGSSSAGTLSIAGNYTIGSASAGAVTLTANTGSLSLVDGTINTLTLADGNASALTLGGGGELAFEISGNLSDQIKLTGTGAGVSSPGSATNVVLTVLSKPSTAGNVTLISESGSSPAGGISAGNFTLIAPNLAGVTFSLANSTSTALILSETINPVTAGAIYFTGAQDSVWGDGNSTASNWSYSSAGSPDAMTTPGSTSDVHFYATNATTANLATSMGNTSYTIHSLTVDGTSLNSPSTAVSIASGGAGGILTITGNATSGISVGAGGQLTISAPLTLGAAQLWTNNSGNLLSITGGVTASSNALTFAGNSSTTISGNTAFTTSSGTSLTVGNATAVTISSPVTLGASTTWTSSNTTNALTVSGAVTGTNTNITGAGAGNITISGNLSLGSGYVYANGANGTVTLLGNNSFSGGIYIGNTTAPATIAITNAAAVGNGTITFGVTGGGDNGFGILSINGSNPVTLGNNVNFNNPGGAYGSQITGNQALTITGNVTFSSGGNPPITVSNSGGTTFGNNTSSTATWALNTLAGHTVIFNGTGNITMNDVITNGTGNNGSLEYNGSAVMALNNANTYTGGTLLNNGTIAINSSGNGTASAIGTGTLTIAGGTLDNTSGQAVILGTNNVVSVTGGASFAAFSGGETNTSNLSLGTGNVSLNIGSGSTQTITLNGNGTTLTFGGNVTAQTNVAGNGLLTVNGAGNTLVLGSLVTNTNTTARTFTIGGTGNVTVNGAISGGNTGEAIVKTGNGTLTLNGASSYSGGTAINAGTVQISGSGNIGNTSAAVTMGTGTSGTIGTVGNLVVNTNVTSGAMSVQSNTATTTGSDVALLSIANGKTLTLSSLAVGVSTSGNVATTNTALGTGSSPGALGTLTVNGNVTFGPTTNNATYNSTTAVDLSGLSNFNQTATSGFLEVGYGTVDFATVTLAASNTISVGTLSIGDSTGGNSNGGTNVLNLGNVTNVLDASTINVGAYKGTGTIQFATSNGNVTIAGTTGGASTANITLGNASSGATYQGTGNNSLLLAGHNATVQAGTVILGQRLAAGGGSAPVGVVTFDTGNFSVNTLEMANLSAGTTGATGIFTLGGPTADSAGNGTLTVNTSLILAKSTGGSGNGIATGSMVINGGTANIKGNITDQSTTGLSSTTLTLAGGILNMNGNFIGGNGSSGNKAIGTLNFESGTLQNVSQINNGAGLNKISDGTGGGGTLILSGTNSYTGGTTITAGTLLANSSDTTHGSTGAGNVNVTANGTLGGVGYIAGNITVNGTITAGTATTTGSPGMLTANGANSTTTLAGNGTYDVKINSASGSGSAGTNWDTLALSGLAVTASGNGSQFNINIYGLNSSGSSGNVTGFDPTMSDTWQIATFSGNTTYTTLSNALAAGDFALTTSNFTNNNSASPSSFSLEAMNDGGGTSELDVVYNASPEPGSAALLLGGLSPMLLARRRRRNKGGNPL